MIRRLLLCVSVLVWCVQANAGTPTQYYVDPSLGTDTGDGSVATPWGRASGSVVDYALATITPDTTNGDQINVKAGTADVLGASLDIAGDYGTPTVTAPLIIRGYTSTANDGGIGAISGAGSYSIHAVGTAAVNWVDMRLYNTGTNYIIYTGTGSNVINCRFDTGGSTVGQVRTIGPTIIAGCSFESSVGGAAIYTSGVTRIIGCYFANGATDFARCVDAAGTTGLYVCNCVFSIDGATNAIEAAENSTIISNSVLSSSGTGSGILFEGATVGGVTIYNNLIEGFSGAGGEAIDFASSDDFALVAGNAYYNNTATYSNSLDILQMTEDDDNEVLDATPFAKSGDNTFTNRFTYFAPVDTGNVHNGAYPFGGRVDKGAVQHADPAGGRETSHTWVR